MERFIAQRGLWNLERENVLQNRGPLPQDEVDVIGECKATYEENWLSSWLRENEKTQGRNNDGC